MFLHAWTSFVEIWLRSRRIAGRGIRKHTKRLWPSGPATYRRHGERIFSQEIVGTVLSEGGLEVRPMMVKVLARFSDADHKEFEASYSRVSRWAKRHDKSATAGTYVAPEVGDLEAELELVNSWFKRVRGYKNA